MLTTRLLLFVALIVTSFNEPQLVDWPLTQGAFPYPNVSDTGTSSYVVSSDAQPALAPVPGTADGFAAVQFFGNSSSAGPPFSNLIIAPGNGLLTSIVGEYKEQISVKACIRPSNYGFGDYQAIVIKRQARWADTPTSAIDAIQMNMLNTNDGTWYAGVAKSTTLSTFAVESVHKLVLNTWQCVGFTYDGTTLQLYKDGVAMAGVAATGDIDYDAQGPWCVGGNKVAGSPGTFGSNSVTGYIRDVQVSSLIQPASWFHM
jgi:hypothetical protein